jgi:hypothetical protein
MSNFKKLVALTFVGLGVFVAWKTLSSNEPVRSSMIESDTKSSSQGDEVRPGQVGNSAASASRLPGEGRRTDVEVLGVLPDGRLVKGMPLRVSSVDGLVEVNPLSGRTFLPSSLKDEALVFGEWTESDGGQYEGTCRVNLASLGEDRTVRLQMQRVSSQFRLTVLREGVPQSNYPIFVSDYSSNREFFTDADGRIQLDALVAGEHVFKLGAPLNPERVVFASLELGVSVSEVVDLRGGELLLEVFNPDGRPASPGIPVALWPATVSERLEMRSPRLCRTDAYGEASFQGPSTGDYLVVVGDEAWARGGSGEGGISPAYIPISFNGGTQVESIYLPLPTKVIITTGIETPNGFRPRPAPVWIESLNGDSIARWGIASTGSDPLRRGIACPPGNLLVRANEWPVGYGEAEVFVREGDTAEVRVVLSKSEIAVTFLLDSDSLSEYDKIWVYDASGGQLGYFLTGFKLPRLSFTTNEGVTIFDTKDGIGDRNFGFPSPGKYSFVATKGRVAAFLGWVDIDAFTEQVPLSLH